MLNKDKLRAAFKLFDLDNNGRITMSEIRYVLRGTGAGLQEPEEWRAIIKEIDKDGDGEISFPEFNEMMQNLLVMTTNTNPPPLLAAHSSPGKS
jgi:calcium-dependent protein kinase